MITIGGDTPQFNRYIHIYTHIYIYYQIIAQSDSPTINVDKCETIIPSYNDGSIFPGSSFKGKTVLVDMDNSLVDWDGEFIRRFAAMAKRPEEEVERVVRNRQKFEIEEGSDVPSAREVSSICRIVCVVCTPLFIFNIYIIFIS